MRDLQTAPPDPDWLDYKESGRLGVRQATLSYWAQAGRLATRREYRWVGNRAMQITLYSRLDLAQLRPDLLSAGAAPVPAHVVSIEPELATRLGCAEPPMARLAFDPETLNITLDGQGHPGTDPTAFRLLQAISQAAPRTITASELQSLPGMRSKRVGRELEKLPELLKAVVRSAPGRGFWIELPAL